MSNHQAIAVENAGYQFVAGDQDQLPDSGNDVGGGAVALASRLGNQISGVLIGVALLVIVRSVR